MSHSHKRNASSESGSATRSGGRDPANTGGTSVWADSILEIEPSGNSGGTVVWAWYLWDHLIQDFDAPKDNYGVVAEHPELVDVNFGPGKADWTRVNSVDCNEELDQIMVPAHNLGEV